MPHIKTTPGVVPPDTYLSLSQLNPDDIGPEESPDPEGSAAHKVELPQATEAQAVPSSEGAAAISMESGLVEMIHGVVQNENGSFDAIFEFRDTPYAPLTEALHRNMEKQRRETGPLTQEDRLNCVLSTFTRIFENDFDEPSYRWAINTALTLLHQGAAVVLATTGRQYLAATTKWEMVNGNISTELATGLALVGPTLAVALNAAGALREELSGEATGASRRGRAYGCGFLLSGLAAAYFTGKVPASLALVGPATGYCVARDLLQAVFPLSTNAGRPSPGMLAINAGIYAGSQFAIGESMNVLTPNSGAGTVTGAGLPRPNNIVHDFGTGALNSIPEMIDAAVNGVLVRNAEIKHNLATIPSDQITREHLRGFAVSIGCNLPVGKKTTSQFLKSMVRQFTTTLPMRLNLFLGLTLCVMAISAMIGNELEDEEKTHALIAVATLLLGLVYPAFVKAHHTQPLAQGTKNARLVKSIKVAAPPRQSNNELAPLSPV